MPPMEPQATSLYSSLHRRHRHRHNSITPLQYYYHYHHHTLSSLHHTTPLHHQSHTTTTTTTPPKTTHTTAPTTATPHSITLRYINSTTVTPQPAHHSTDGSLYKERYERLKREGEVRSKRQEAVHEEDLARLEAAKRGIEKKVVLM